MSHSKPMHSFGSDLDDALEELYADFDKKYNIPSTANPISSQQSKRQKPSANPSSSNTFKRNTNPASETNASKFQRLDDNEVADLYSQKCIEDLEQELFNEYMQASEDELDQEQSSSSHAEEVAEDDESDDEIHPVPSCVPCSSSTSKLEPKKHFKSSDSDLKNYAFSRPGMGIGRCSKDCKFGGTCVEETTIGDMQDMVNDFWDDDESDAPSAATRRLKILTILRKSYQPNEDEFQFFAGCKIKNNRRVCEAGFLILLGISNSPIASTAPGQWKRMKKYVAEGKDLAGIEYKSVGEEKLMKAESKSNKMKSALTFIEYFAKEFGDTIPGAEGKR